MPGRSYNGSDPSKRGGADSSSESSTLGDRHRRLL